MKRSTKRFIFFLSGFLIHRVPVNRTDSVSMSLCKTFGREGCDRKIVYQITFPVDSGFYLDITE